MSFWGSLFGGSSPELNNSIAQTGQQATWDSGQGQSDILAGTNFQKDILSGDATKQAGVLSPVISAQKTAVQQDQKTNAENGTRSGGTAAGNVAAQDQAHGNITQALAQLMGNAATQLPQIGTNLTSQSLSAQDLTAKLVQQRIENWNNSILGKGITGAASAAESAGLGAGAGALTPGMTAGEGAGAGLADSIG